MSRVMFTPNESVNDIAIRISHTEYKIIFTITNIMIDLLTAFVEHDNVALLKLIIETTIPCDIVV